MFTTGSLLRKLQEWCQLVQFYLERMLNLGSCFNRCQHYYSPNFLLWQTGIKHLFIFLLEIQWTLNENIRCLSSIQIGLVVIINNFLGKQINTLDSKIKTEKLILKWKLFSDISKVEKQCFCCNFLSIVMIDFCH